MADDVFCCLGTTQKKAGSRAAFERVDYHLVLEFARAALAQGARQFLVVSSVGASLKSGSFYQCHSGGCAKYKGDKTNRLASVAMIESPAGAPKLHYLVAVTSNVLRVNSAVAHQTLALRIQRLVERMHPTSLPESPTEGSFATVPVDDPDLPSESENDAP